MKIYSATANEEYSCKTSFFLYDGYFIQDLCNKELEVPQWNEVFPFDSGLGGREIGFELSY
jgi:hypothetical protein